MTAPACRNPKCGQHLRKRRNSSAYQGACGYCRGCYQRWNNAGQPESGPPDPVPLSEVNAAFRDRERAEKEARMDEFWRLRRRGFSVGVAARRVGVTPKHGEKYETELRRRQREASVAA